MFDFFRERGSTAEDKRREALGAYLDNALTPAERTRFERQLAGDPAMRAELEQMRLLKRQMRAMPRRRVPRSFALNPALYSRPKPQPMMQLYPVLRGATALTAFFLIFTLALGAFRGQFTGGEDAPTAVFTTAEIAQEAVQEEAAPAEGAAAAGEEERSGESAAVPTEAVMADLAAQEAITETFAIEAVPPAEGTPMPEGTLAVGEVPSTELSLESDAPSPPAATETPAVLAYNEPPPPVATEIATIAEEETLTAQEDATQADPLAGVLRPLQIGLGVAFILLLVLWLVARRRARSL